MITLRDPVTHVLVQIQWASEDRNDEHFVAFQPVVVPLDQPGVLNLLTNYRTRRDLRYVSLVNWRASDDNAIVTSPGVSTAIPPKGQPGDVLIVPFSR